MATPIGWETFYCDTLDLESIMGWCTKTESLPSPPPSPPTPPSPPPPPPPPLQPGASIYGVAPIKNSDGVSVDGWRTYKGATLSPSWSFSDGILTTLPSANNEDLISMDTYSNFTFEVEWKVPVIEDGGANGGIFYLVNEGGAQIWNSGFEYQVLDNERHADGGTPTTSAASVYDYLAPSYTVAPRVDEWNQAKIVVLGDNVQHWLNGHQVCSFSISSFLSTIADTKFLPYAGFFGKKPGALGLQHHGEAGIQYRNFKITTA